MPQQNKDGWPSGLLLVFFGMIATGKSYLASAWAEHYGLPYYNSDRVRKELAGLVAQASQEEAVDQGIYTPAFSRRTYDSLIDHADKHLQQNPRAAVVLDGSYQSAEERELLRDRFGSRVRLVFVHCYCGEEVVKKRLLERAKDPDAVSDGRWDIYLAQKKRAQPVTPEEQAQMITLDTDAPLEKLLQEVDRRLLELGV